MSRPVVTIDRLDHLVLTVNDIETTCNFYQDVLGMRREDFGEGRVALHFGNQKINLHPNPSPIDIKAAVSTPGSADLCFITETPIEIVKAELQDLAIPIEAGPVARVGALGPMTSVYFRDPDGNLIEVSNY